MGVIKNCIANFLVILLCANLPAIKAAPLDSQGYYSSQSALSSTMGTNGSYQSSTQTESTDSDGNTVVHTQTVGPTTSGGSSSVTTIQGQNIRNCGPLPCPDSTTSCVQSSKTSPDNSLIYTQYICANSRGQNLSEQTTSAKNPNKNMGVNSMSINSLGFNGLNNFHSFLPSLPTMPTLPTMPNFPSISDAVSNINRAMSSLFPIFSFGL